MTKFRLILLIEAATLILLSPFLNLPRVDAWSFDEVMGAPGRLIRQLSGKPQAQAPLPVPRNEMPPIGNNADINPCAAPPPSVAQDSYRQVQVAQEPAPVPVVRTSSRIQIVRSVGQGQTLSGLMARVTADDAWYDPTSGKGWVLVFNDGRQKYTLTFDRNDRLISREVN